VPRAEDLNTNGLDLDPRALEALLTVDPAAARGELDQVEQHLGTFGDRLPEAVRRQFERTRERLQADATECGRPRLRRPAVQHDLVQSSACA
jgi:phosphoenolpyruvate carboxykinase (GTP)